MALIAACASAPSAHPPSNCPRGSVRTAHRNAHRPRGSHTSAPDTTPGEYVPDQSDATTWSVPLLAMMVARAGTTMRRACGERDATAAAMHIAANEMLFSAMNSSRVNAVPDTRDAHTGNVSPPHASSLTCSTYERGNAVKGGSREVCQCSETGAGSPERLHSRVSFANHKLRRISAPPETTMSDSTAAINATNLGCSLTCKDLEASIRFYRDAIGFTVGQTFEREGKVVAAVVGAGECRIVLNQDDGKLGWDRIKGQGSYLQINVASAADVDAAAARIKAAGGALLDEPADRPWGVRMFQFKDLDGFKLGVSTPLAG